MPIEVNGIEHQDKSKDVSLSFTKGNDKVAAFGSIDVAHAAASAAHIPIAKRTDYSISTGLKLHETPTSSFSANIGASKSASPFAKGDWQPNAFFVYRKKF
ncbi:unnamed protein product, partial [Iphiclides podalirius]